MNRPCLLLGKSDLKELNSHINSLNRKFQDQVCVRQAKQFKLEDILLEHKVLKFCKPTVFEWLMERLLLDNL